MPHSTATRLAEIENDGYTIIENVMGPELMTRIRTELEPYCQGEYLGRNNFEGTHTERVYALLAKAPSIAEIIEHPTTLRFCAYCLGAVRSKSFTSPNMRISCCKV